ncbi:MAG: squalene/phytoene synthase family protein [Rhodospirillales bacterium]|nr:squalene/phytoene synthase family protein [Rhodospirillales bacterium]
MQDLSYCADRVHRSDNDRFLCAQFAPADKREALYAIYALNLELATIPAKVSEPILGEIRFQWWRDSLDGVFCGNPLHHEVMGPLTKAVQDFVLDRAPFERLIDTRKRDLDETPIADMVAFDDYAAGTAGVLARLTLDIVGVDDPVALEAASNVAIAWAVCGILRAVPYHSSRGQVFLPQDLPKGTDAKEAARKLADYAARRLAAARQSVNDIPREALPALLPSVLAEAWLRRLEKASFNTSDPALQRMAPTRPLRLWFHARRGKY